MREMVVKRVGTLPWPKQKLIIDDNGYVARIEDIIHVEFEESESKE